MTLHHQPVNHHFIFLLLKIKKKQLALCSQISQGFTSLFPPQWANTRARPTASSAKRVTAYRSAGCATVTTTARTTPTKTPRTAVSSQAGLPAGRWKVLPRAPRRSVPRLPSVCPCFMELSCCSRGKPLQRLPLLQPHLPPGHRTLQRHPGVPGWR